VITFWLVVSISFAGSDNWRVLHNDKQPSEEACKTAAIEAVTGAAHHPPFTDDDGKDQEYEIAVTCSVHHSKGTSL
jgi:hypothetical protein